MSVSTVEELLWIPSHALQKPPYRRWYLHFSSKPAEYVQILYACQTDRHIAWLTFPLQHASHYPDCKSRGLTIISSSVEQTSLFPRRKKRRAYCLSPPLPAAAPPRIRRRPQPAAPGAWSGPWTPPKWQKSWPAGRRRRGGICEAQGNWLKERAKDVGAGLGGAVPGGAGRSGGKRPFLKDGHN